MSSVPETEAATNLARIADALEREAAGEIRALLEELHPAEIAHLLEALPPEDRDRVWDELDPEKVNDVLAEAEDEVRAARLGRMDAIALAAAAQDLDPDDAIDLLQDLPEEVIDQVLRAMDEQQRRRLESALVYSEDTAGGLMNIDVLTVRADVTLGTVIRYLRAKGEIPEKTDRLIVVDRDNRYLGMLRLAGLLIHGPQRVVSEVMETEVQGIAAETPAREVALLFEQRDLISAPVVDAGGRVLGRITIDDVVDVIRDEGEHSFMSLAGMSEDYDMFAPVLVSTRRRTVWLGINLLTALLAAWVIGLFEATIRELVALAVLMPVVASMGGIAGTQVLTVVIRGIALGQVERHNAVPLLARELAVAAISSLLLALALGVIAIAWFESPGLGLIVAIALVLNVLVAAAAGVSIPLVLRRLGIDPALAGGVILTTVTDVVGFLAFLGLGTLFLLTAS